MSNSSKNQSNVTNLDQVREAKAKTASISIAEPQDQQSEHGNRRFDAEKVARIKAAIAAGEYVVDPQRVANKFIEHDRNQ